METAITILAISCAVLGIGLIASGISGIILSRRLDRVENALKRE